MQNNLLISIIMPVYNCDKYIAEAIESVRSQTYQDFELIIIDDFSTDQSNKIALEYSQKDDRIKVIQNKYEKGIHGASNSGLDIAKGSLIAKADADDVQRIYRLEEEIDFLNKNPSIDIVGGGYQLFGDKNNMRVFRPKNYLILAWKFISDIYFCNPTVMFRRRVLETMPRYPSVVCEDFMFLSGALRKHRGKNIDKVLIDYRQHQNNYSHVKANKIKESAFKIFQDNFLFYMGNLYNSEIFYEFHANEKLKLKNILIINSISKKIIKKICTLYDKRNFITRYIYLYIFVTYKILKSLAKYYAIKLYK